MSFQSSSPNNSPSAIVHAFGGCIGSALSLFLLYPLERVRIELQTSLSEAATPPETECNLPSPRSSSSSSPLLSIVPDASSSAAAFSSSSDASSASSSPLYSKDANEIPPLSQSLIETTEITHRIDHVVTSEKSSSSQQSNGDSAGGTSSSSFVVLDTDPPPSSSTEIYSSSSASTSISTSSSMSTHLPQPISSTIVKHSDNRSSPPLLPPKDDSKNEEDNENEPNSNEGNLKTTSIQKEQPKKSRPMWKQFITLYEQGELYRGVKPIVTSLAISNFIFFYAHEIMKRLFVYSTQKTLNTGITTTETTTATTTTTTILPPSIWKSLLASTLAGIVNVLLTNPLWVANMRIVKGGGRTPQNNQPKTNKVEESIITTIRTIINNEGIGQLWSGTFASLLLVSNPAIQHFTYERLKSQLLQMKRQTQMRNNPHSLSNGSSGRHIFTILPLEAFVLGAISKAIATILTYPLQLAQVLMRLQKKRKEQGHSDKDNTDSTTHTATATTFNSTSKTKHPQFSHAQYHNKDHPMQVEMEYRNTIDCMLKLFHKGGFIALYSGMNAKMIQTVLTAAFTFLTYEQIVKIVHSAFLSLQTVPK